MAIEFVVFLDDDTTEEEQKDIARYLSMFPTVQGVYRHALKLPPGVVITHSTPEATQ